LVPLALAVVAPPTSTAAVVTGGALLALAILGAVAARAGGAPQLSGALRVTLWGAGAMGLTALVGKWFGTVV
jgi:VIT1/CCC1 family predicted Fe2+/Mn2+ transporter